MFYIPENRDFDILPHDPVKAIVAPRPIGWISTLSEDGNPNLAPYSFFNAIGGMPPMLMFASEGMKDSAKNAVETGEFVFNYASEHLEAEMNKSSAPAPSGVNEFDYVGLETAKSEVVAAPRVAAAHAALECKVTAALETKDINGELTGAIVIIGQVVGVHINEAVIKDGRFDVNLAKPISRLGYLDFGKTSDLHELARPSWDGEAHQP
jgi:flavin reductase (DIM6/NTAB) family NADH-FMN oxidoreductase RutF